jgi:sulfur-oxidizing protein SoxY
VRTSRRYFLEFAASCGLVAAIGAGAVRSVWARAMGRNTAAFESKTVNEALQRLGAGAAAESRDVVVQAPDIAENGAMVPVAVTSRIPDTREISIIAAGNPLPLAATFDVSGNLEPYVSTRIKMGGTADVWAVVRAGGRSYTARKRVTITLGACG